MRKTHIIAVFATALALMAPPALAEPVTTEVQADGGYAPPKPKEGFRYPDCFCTDSGGKRVDLGKMACLTIGSRSFTARCAMSQNNPTWRQVSEGCHSV